MNIIYRITFVFSLLFILFSVAVSKSKDNGRGKLHLVHADYSISKEENGKIMRIIYGNVYFVQDSISIKCDSAVYHQDYDKLSLWGKVIIVRGAETVRAKHIVYYKNEKKAVANGNVAVAEKGKELKAEHLTYYFGSKNSFARKSVIINDNNEGFNATCEEFDNFPSAFRSVLRRNVVVTKTDSSNTDTLVIKSDTLVYYSADSSRKLFSYGNVEFVQKEITAYCDSAHYFIDGDTILLFEKPEVLQNNNQMRGERIEIYLKERKPDMIYIVGRAELHSILDSLTGKEDLLKANEIFIRFADDSVRTILAKKNAIGRYHISEGGEKGVNFLTADSLVIFIEKNKVDSIFVGGGAEGTYYPEKLAEKNL